MSGCFFEMRCTCELNFTFKFWLEVVLHIIHKCMLYVRFYGNAVVTSLLLLSLTVTANVTTT